MTVPAPFVYNAVVVYVHDGDTIYVVIDRGMYDYCGALDHPIPIRLYGINARELGERGGNEASDNLSGILPPGAPVVLHTMKPDKYAPRWDAIVETATIPDLSAHLVATQWAAIYFGSGVKAVPPWPRTVE